MGAGISERTEQWCLGFHVAVQYSLKRLGGRGEGTGKLGFCHYKSCKETETPRVSKTEGERAMVNRGGLAVYCGE